MLDIQFLNDKASKLVLFLKKADKILKNGEEQFLKIPMYPDRTQYYLISAYNELEEICCHLLREITGEKLKGGCVEKIAKEQLFSEKINRVLIDFSSYIKGVMESNYKYTPKEIFIIGSQTTTILLDRFIKELSSVVKEIKAKEPKLSIPVNVKKLQDHAKAIKSSIRKISNFLNFPVEEFASTPLFIDRARYFSVVLIDSSLWICRHILRKSGKKVGTNCFQQLYQEGFIDKETAENLETFTKYRDIFADPTKDFNSEKLYELLKRVVPYFLNFLSEISKAIFKKTK